MTYPLGSKLAVEFLGGAPAAYAFLYVLPAENPTADTL